MDAHIIISIVLSALLGSVSWWVKGVIARVDELEKNLGDHKVEDAREISKLNAQNNDIGRRLQSIEDKLDHILEKIYIK